MKNKTIEINTVIGSADINENAKMKTKRPMNKKNSIRVICNSDMFLIILKNKLFKILKILEIF